MPTPGPNDIKASFIVEDQASATLKQIDREAARTTGNLSRGGEKTKSVFDRWNFSINAMSVAMKIFHAWLQRSPEVMAAWNGALDYGIAKVNDFAASILKNFGVDSDILRIGSLGSLLADTDKLQAANEKLDQTLRKVKEDTFSAARASMIVAGAGISANAETLNAVWKQLVGYMRTANDEQIKLNLVAGQLSEITGVNAEEAKKLAQRIIAIGAAWKKARAEAEDKPLIDPAAFANDHAAAVAKSEADDARRAKEEADRAAMENFTDGWARASKEIEDDYLKMGVAAQRFAKETQRTFSEDLFDAVTGKAIQFRDVFSHILMGLTRQFTDAASASLFSIFSGGGNKATGGGLGGLIGGILNAPASPVPSGGGSAGSTADIPHGATGGIFTGPRSGYLAVLHGTEKVEPLGGRKVSELGAASSGAAAPVVNIHLNAIDGRSAADFLETPAAQKRIGDAVIRAMSSRMDVRRAIG